MTACQQWARLAGLKAWGVLRGRASCSRQLLGRGDCEAVSGSLTDWVVLLGGMRLPGAGRHVRTAAAAAADPCCLLLLVCWSARPQVLPVPSFNVINGGEHAGNGLAMQEFMILPTG